VLRLRHRLRQQSSEASTNGFNDSPAAPAISESGATAIRPLNTPRPLPPQPSTNSTIGRDLTQPGSRPASLGLSVAGPLFGLRRPKPPECPVIAASSGSTTMSAREHHRAADVLGLRSARGPLQRQAHSDPPRHRWSRDECRCAAARHGSSGCSCGCRSAARRHRPVGRKLFIEAHASIGVPSTEKCPGLKSRLIYAWLRTRRQELGRDFALKQSGEVGRGSPAAPSAAARAESRAAQMGVHCLGLSRPQVVSRCSSGPIAIPWLPLPRPVFRTLAAKMALDCRT
jgi:hypothetical protein